jgi:toxin-antitoxin system PIN domain toxin
MDLPDNNILINALRSEAPHHQVAKEWLENTLNQGAPLRLFPTVEAGFLRVVTNPKIYMNPTPFDEAWLFLKTLCAAPGVEITQWTQAARERWARICGEGNLSGNDCNDAMLAAIAIERGLRLVTFDRGFRRFDGLSLLLLDD